MSPEMTHWKERYRVSGAGTWQGRHDGLRFHQLVRPIDFSQGLPLPPKDRTGIAIIGFACDVGIKRNQGRVGAVGGPEALRQALGKLAVPDEPNFILYDLGDIVCTDGNLESSQAALATLVAKVVRHGMIPIVFGGGHELAWGHYQGLALAVRPADIGIINIDAHYDLRDLENDQGTSGTSFWQIAQSRQAAKLPLHYGCIGIQPFGNTNALVTKAKELGVVTVTAAELDSDNLQTVDWVLANCEEIYLSLCMDVFAAAVAPGVSAPQPLGLMPWQVIPILKKVAESGRLVGFDVAELSPPHDRDGATAALAAAMVATVIAGIG